MNKKKLLVASIISAAIGVAFMVKPHTAAANFGDYCDATCALGGANCVETSCAACDGLEYYGDCTGRGWVISGMSHFDCCNGASGYGGVIY